MVSLKTQTLCNGKAKPSEHLGVFRKTPLPVNMASDLLTYSFWLQCAFPLKGRRKQPALTLSYCSGIIHNQPMTLMHHGDGQLRVKGGSMFFFFFFPVHLALAAWRYEGGGQQAISGGLNDFSVIALARNDERRGEEKKSVLKWKNTTGALC